MVEVKKINCEWICKWRSKFFGYLDDTKFPNPLRNGERGPEFEYPERLIMFIALIAVKHKIKTYQELHRFVTIYWKHISGNKRQKVISESQLRYRLKKFASSLEKLQDLSCKKFIRRYGIKRVSSDKMIIRFNGRICHKKYKEQGIMPKGLRNVDKEATWSKSRYDGWVYGHGSFSMVSMEASGLTFLLMFKWMRNSSNEAKRMWLETGKLEGLVTESYMDSKADDSGLFFEMLRQRRMLLVTAMRKGTNRSERRKLMKRILSKKRLREWFKKRSTTVEPMQSIVKDIFDIERCWMKGDANNRWLFASMGIAIQIAQRDAVKEGNSPWKVKEAVLN